MKKYIMLLFLTQLAFSQPDFSNMTGNDFFDSYTEKLSEEMSAEEFIMGMFNLGLVKGTKGGYDLGMMQATIILEDRNVLTTLESADFFANNSLDNRIPDAVTYGQMRDLVYQFLKKNPQIRHHDIELIIIKTLDNTFPKRLK